MAVGFGGLTEDESNLIKVAKFYHENHAAFERTVVKLNRAMGLSTDSIAAMTGLTPGQVRGVIRRKGFIAEHVVPKAEKPQPKVEPKVESNRLEIHVNNESDLAQRVAYDAAKYIERKMNPGDAWLTGKEMMAKFEIGNRTTTEVRRILVSHDWIQLADENNKRLGYVVI
jgi:hypothetical protein